MRGHSIGPRWWIVLASCDGRVASSSREKILMATVGAAAAALAAGVMWTAPSASDDTDYCNALAPKDARERNCGFDNAPGSQELHDCLYGNAPAPGA
jgi:hypothetical protein